MYKKKIIYILHNFHTILSLKESQTVISSFSYSISNKSKSQFIITGTRYNAMQTILQDVGSIKRLEVSPIEIDDCINFIVKGFNVVGKVIDKTLAQEVFKFWKGNLKYVSQHMYFCDKLSRGFINKNIVDQGLDMLLCIHHERFYDIIASLTGFQINYIRAIIDGVKNISSTSIINKYDLHSYANVVRLQEAVVKKEIVFFNSNFEPIFLDILFEYWLRNKYFSTNE